MAPRTSTTPAQPTASRSARRRYASPSAATAGPRTPSSWCRTACASISRPASAGADESFTKIGASCSNRYRSKFPDLADQIERMQRRELPEGWDADLPVFPADAKGVASRDSSGKVLNAIASHYPWLIGGSADLAPSTKTRLTFEGAGDLEADTPGGRNLHFGIREHAMGAILNGLALSKIRAYRLRLPHLLRLHEAADPAGRADGAAGHLYLHARIRSAWARTGRRISRSSSSSRCAAFPGSSRCAPPTPMKSSKRGASSSASSISQPAWC